MGKHPPFEYLTGRAAANNPSVSVAQLSRVFWLVDFVSPVGTLRLCPVMAGIRLVRAVRCSGATRRLKFVQCSPFRSFAPTDTHAVRTSVEDFFFGDYDEQGHRLPECQRIRICLSSPFSSTCPSAGRATCQSNNQMDGPCHRHEPSAGECIPSRCSGSRFSIGLLIQVRRKSTFVKSPYHSLGTVPAGFQVKNGVIDWCFSQPLFAGRNESRVTRESCDQVFDRAHSTGVRGDVAIRHDDLFECAVLVKE
jgi:hypothetical protein